MTNVTLLDVFLTVVGIFLAYAAGTFILCVAVVCGVYRLFGGK